MRAAVHTMPADLWLVTAAAQTRINKSPYRTLGIIPPGGNFGASSDPVHNPVSVGTPTHSSIHARRRGQDFDSVTLPLARELLNDMV